MFYIAEGLNILKIQGKTTEFFQACSSQEAAQETAKILNEGLLVEDTENVSPVYHTGISHTDCYEK